MDEVREAGVGQVIQIDEVQIRDHLGEMVRGTDEDALIGIYLARLAGVSVRRIGDNRTLRRPLHPGAIAQVSARHARGMLPARRREGGDDWLWKIPQRTRPKQAAIALANRLAGTVHALLKTGTDYRASRPA